MAGVMKKIGIGLGYFILGGLAGGLGIAAGCGISMFGNRGLSNKVELKLGETKTMEFSKYLSIENYDANEKYVIEPDNYNFLSVSQDDKGKSRLVATGVGEGELSIYNEDKTEKLATVPYKTSFGSALIEEKIREQLEEEAEDGFVQSELETITSLELKDVTIEVFTDISALKRLETLTISGCTLRGVAYSETGAQDSYVNLYGMTHLKTVDFSNNTLDNIEALNECTSLTNINVAGNKNIERFSIGENMKSLKEINIKGNEKMILSNEVTDNVKIVSDQQPDGVKYKTPYSYRVCKNAEELKTFLEMPNVNNPHAALLDFKGVKEITIPKDKNNVRIIGAAGSEYQLSFLFEQREETRAASITFDGITLKQDQIVKATNVKYCYIGFANECVLQSTSMKNEPAIEADNLTLSFEKNANATVKGCDTVAEGVAGVAIKANFLQLLRSENATAADSMQFNVVGGSGAQDSEYMIGGGAAVEVAEYVNVEADVSATFTGGSGINGGEGGAALIVGGKTLTEATGNDNVDLAETAELTLEIGGTASVQTQEVNEGGENV